MGDEENEINPGDEGTEEDADPSVPTDLLDLHVELEDAGITPEAFKEVYGE